MPDPRLLFVTSNPNKALEAERILGQPLLSVDFALPEIQAASVEEVTRHKLEFARTHEYGPLLVEDVSLGFEELNDFPGPFVHWLLKAAGGEGLAAIAYSLRNRAAIARCCVGYFDGTSTHLILGETRGTILVEPRGKAGFGWDAWFQPDGSTRTYAEMSEAEKDRISHRGRAYRALQELLSAAKASDSEQPSSIEDGKL
ncbi:MAG: non-canonical purine NTP pyrophosphatase [Thermoanaerobaculia bacterium]